MIKKIKNCQELKIISKLFYPILIILIALFALKSLLSVPFYTSHDSFTHTVRIAAYSDSLTDGQLPVRWAKNLNGQLGSPIFTYSYPLVYMIGAGMHFIGILYEDAFRYIVASGYVLSGLAMYLWLSTRFSKNAAFLGALIYLWSPYRFLNVYVRGAIAENFAFIFMPLILWAIDKNKWALLTLSTTGLLLSHNVVSAMFLPVVGLWSLINKKSWRVFWCVLLAFGISAFIYIPDFFERQFIAFDKGISYWADHFVYVQQFVRSKWDYGFDLPGMINDAMSFELGLANWLVLLLTGLSLPFIIKKIEDKKSFFAIVLVGMTVVFLAIYSPVTKLFWEKAPIIKTIVDFPWRWLGILPLVIGFIGATLINYLPKKVNFLVCLFLAVFVLIANRNHLRVNEAVTYGDAAYENYTGTATATSNEYTPKDHTNAKFPLNTPRIEGINITPIVQVLKNNVNEQAFRILTDKDGEIRINRLYFPETLIFKDGILTKDWSIITSQTYGARFDDTGTIAIKIASPGATISVIFEETALRKFANILSIVSLLFVSVILLRNVKK